MEREREPNQYTVFIELYESLLSHTHTRAETFEIASRQFMEHHGFKPYLSFDSFKARRSRKEKSK